METFRLKVTVNLDGQRLDKAIFELIHTSPAGISQMKPSSANQLSRGVVRKSILGGAAYINGRRCKIASKPVNAGDKLTVHIRLSENKVKNWAQDHGPLKEDRILFEDSALIILNKPPYMPTHGTLDSDRNHLEREVKNLLKLRGIKNPYLGLHHRLDSLTSGVILFSKKTSANKNLAESFQNREVKKTYIAVAEDRRNSAEFQKITNPISAKSGLLEDFLKKIPGRPMRVRTVKSGGKSALTHYEILDQRAKTNFSKSSNESETDIKTDLILLKLFPKTGRTHQLRVQLASRGLPILGDPLYGTGKQGDRLYLHANLLELTHPLSGESLKIEAPLPKEFTDFF